MTEPGFAEPQPEQTGPLAARHVLAAVIGNALEFYDFTIYATFAISIGHAFFPNVSRFWNLMFSLLVFAAGFVTRPIGGYFIGSWGDRAGRKPAMLLSFGLMGASIIGLALIPSFGAIGWFAPVLALTARAVQG